MAASGRGRCAGERPGLGGRVGSWWRARRPWAGGDVGVRTGGRSRGRRPGGRDGRGPRPGPGGGGGGDWLFVSARSKMAAGGADGRAGRAGEGAGDAVLPEPQRPLWSRRRRPRGLGAPGGCGLGPGPEAGRRFGRRRHCCPAGARPGARRTGRGERWPAPRPGASVRPRPGVSRREGRCLGGGGGAAVGARGRARVTHLLRRRGPRTRVSVNYWVRWWRRPGPAAPVGSVQPGGLLQFLISRSILLTK